ncbi:MAG: hypothetical protein ABIR92_02820 [Gemmatimonadaceae bacterium]
MEEKRPAPPKLSREDQILRLVRAYIGPRWDRHYAKAWRKLGSAGGVNIGVSWNWAAAFLTVPWLAYRKHGSLAIGLILFFAIVYTFVGPMILRLTGSPYPILGMLAIVGLLFGLYGDVIILQRGYQVAAEAHNEAGATQAVASDVIKAGGVSAWRAVGTFVLPAAGLSLVYFALWLPYSSGPRRAEEVFMRRYLTELTANQEQYYRDHQRYAAGESVYPADSVVGREYPPPVIASKDSTFTAILESPRVPDLRCAVAIGVANPLSSDTTRGSIACR